MASLFTPNYGAASSHIEELMREREDFVEANRTQAARIQQLERANATLKEDAAASAEQVSVQSLIAESRARQLDELTKEATIKDAQITKLRSAVRLLWGVHQTLQQLSSEQVARARARYRRPLQCAHVCRGALARHTQAGIMSQGTDLLESLDALLSEQPARAPKTPS